MVGIDELLSLPDGCGEQKMINIAPVVYLMNYLEITRSLTADMRVTFQKKLLDGKGWPAVSCIC